MSSETKKKCRQYSIDYLAYGFIQSTVDIKKPMCLLCMAVLSNESMRPCKLRKHLETTHEDKKDKPVEFFKKLRDDFRSRKTILQVFNEKSSMIDNGLIASYEISQLIAKVGREHTIAESLILPSVSIVISRVMNQNPNAITQVIPLSNSSVSRRIDEMADDVEKQLIAHLQVKKFALQLDESSIRDSEALLMAYVRFQDNDKFIEEMLFARKLKTDTKGEKIYQEVKNFFMEKNIPLENILACATDGAASMVGKYRGFITYLKNDVPNIFCIHCVIHRQHLVAKKLGGRLHASLNIVIKTINFIKSSPLRDRLFRQLCEENEEGFERLLLHTEVRWLSKGNSLKRFVVLWNSIISFMKDAEFGEELVSVKCDIFYLSDIFEKLNLLNKQLQGKNCNLITCKKVINAFLGKLNLFITNIGRRELAQFSSLATILNEIQDDDLEIYINHLKQLREDMRVRFIDIINLNIPDWVIDPFSVNAADINIELQECLVDLQSDMNAQVRFKLNKDNFWISNEIASTFPQLWEKARLYFIAFPTSYLVESGFSRVMHLLSKARNRLDVVQRGDLRMSLTTLKPEINKLAKLHQAQGSH